VKRTKIARTTKDPGSAQEHFPPEFLNRIDEIIMFSPLTLEQMYSIVDLYK